ncbi:MAG: amidohydrolase family protein, partial [Acidimicrobiales bacterium]
IDFYSHVCPSSLMEALANEYPTAESAALDRRPYLYDAEARLRFMDEVGVDTQVLVLVRPPMWLGMPRKVMYSLQASAHDGIAAMVHAHEGRFAGVAVAPVVDDEVLKELHRAWDELGLQGVLIFSNIEGRPVDSPEMWPLYDECERAGQPIWIHPQHTEYLYPWIKESLLDRSLAWPFDTSLAMARLVYGGVLERHHDLKVVTHHLGGMIPYFGARLEAFDHEIAEYSSLSLTKPNEVQLKKPVGEYFRRFYNDTAVSYSPGTLECGVGYFGSDHVLFGTDFPMGSTSGEQWTRDILRSIADADVTAEVRTKILGGNASEMLGLG